MTDQFIISLSLFGRCSDGHSDILIINLCYFTLLAIGFGLDHEGQSILFGHDTLRYIQGLLLFYNLFLFLFVTLHYILRYKFIEITRGMRRTSLKAHPLQESIDSFHRSPLYQCRQQLKGEEGRLKKIGRNRLNFKETPLHSVNPLRDKENQMPNHSKNLLRRETKPMMLERHSGKNLSFGHLKVINMEQRLSRMVASQKDISQQSRNSKLKDAALKKQFYIRDRKLLPMRNSLSANIRKEHQEAPPQGVRQFRKILAKQRSKELKQEELRQLSPCQLAQKYAEQARTLTAPNASRHPLRSPSLEDFINEWKGRL